MDNFLEKDKKIRITPFDNPEETKAGYIKAISNEKIIIKFDENVDVSVLEKYLGQEMDISCVEERCLIKFISTVLALDENILSISMPQEVNKIQRREYTRVNAELPVCFVDEKGNSFNSYTYNISGGGMRVVSNCKVPMGSRIQAQVRLKNRLIDTIFEVLRIEKNNENSEYFVAGVFKNIKNVDRIYLVQYCFKKQLEQSCVKV